MVDQDMVFRAGIMLAVLVLAGVFGASLASRMRIDKENTITGIATQIRKVLDAVHQSDEGSSVLLDFGGDGKSTGHGYYIPDRIGSESYDLEISNGLIVIVSDQDREIVEQGEWIMASFRPLIRGPISEQMKRSLDSSSSGFSIRTPCQIVLDHPGGGENGEVFIYPREIILDPVFSEIEPVVEVLEDAGTLLPGWSDQAEISSGSLIAIENDLILFSPGPIENVEGDCVIPLPIQGPALITFTLEDLNGYNGTIQISKESIELIDGSLEIRTVISRK